MKWIFLDKIWVITNSNDKDAAAAVMAVIKLDPEKFRLGHTKVFFRAGILGFMEEVREDRIGSVIAWLQAQARGKASRLCFKKLQDQKLSLYCLQRTIRNYHIGRTWLWWQLWYVKLSLFYFSKECIWSSSCVLRLDTEWKSDLQCDL